MYRLTNNKESKIKQKALLGTVLKKGDLIFAYGEDGTVLCTKRGDEIIGYTYRTFSIRKDTTIYVFDLAGKPLYTKPL